MVRDDLYITVPSYFRCPISLDVMKSPVSLCTGVTYDRASIQRWLDGGNNTCPATMQVLQTKELVPNHTLHRLITLWSNSNNNSLKLPTTTTNNSPPSPLTPDRANHLIHQLETDLRNLQNHYSVYHVSQFMQNISRLASFSSVSCENARSLSNSGGRLLPLLVSLVARTKDLSHLDRIIPFGNVLLREITKSDSEALRLSLSTNHDDLKLPILMCLKQGSLELRIAAAKFLDQITAVLETHCRRIAEDEEVYSELLRLITTCNWNPEAMDASLSLLSQLATVKRNRAKLVRARGVGILATALSEAEMSSTLTEKVLKLLEIASSCKEGRIEISGNETCVKAIVRKLLKLSNAATENAVTVLWSMCCLFGDRSVSAAVAESNGVYKMLLLLQSNCSPAVRQMCGDLLRVFRCNSKISSSSGSSCLAWYDSKTTHIMPF